MTSDATNNEAPQVPVNPDLDLTVVYTDGTTMSFPGARNVSMEGGHLSFAFPTPDKGYVGTFIPSTSIKVLQSVMSEDTVN